MDELKPCPFCGGKAEIEFSGVQYLNGDWKGYIICRCLVCGASVIGSYYKGEEIIDIPLEETLGGYKAKERWNRRDGKDG